MSGEHTEISIKGRRTRVPSVRAGAANVVTTGRWLRVARIEDEDYYEGEAANDPEKLVAEFKAQGGSADLFTFCQRIPELRPRHQYPMHWDNVAAIPLVSYSDWWEGLSQETRRNVRLAAKRGLVVREVPLSDELIQGMAEIYNETPFRQGRRFWHYGKDFETIKRDLSTFPERSLFIGAYCGQELIGFIKIVQAAKVAGIMQILCKSGHQDKRPMNALVAKAVEICTAKGCSHLLYCKYVYHRNIPDALTEFKRRNGFKQIDLPRYFVPLTLKGRLAVALRLQFGLAEILPRRVLGALLKARQKYYESRAAAGISGSREASGARTGC